MKERVDGKNAVNVSIACAAKESGDDRGLREKLDVERVCMTNSAGVLVL